MRTGQGVDDVSVATASAKNQNNLAQPGRDPDWKLTQATTTQQL